ncbi:MAG: HU family DNA-binding protein [bacterium]|nr:HU family DNA-binding protein [bacterium]
MNKQELADKLTEKFQDVPKAKMVDIIESMLAVITETIKGGGEVAFSGFGAFTAKTRKGRMGINPQTKAAIEILPVTVPKFKAGKTLKDALRAQV